MVMMAGGTEVVTTMNAAENRHEGRRAEALDHTREAMRGLLFGFGLLLLGAAVRMGRRVGLAGSRV